MKKLANNKNGNFKTLMSREMHMLNKESNEGTGKYVETLWKGWKTMGEQRGECPSLLDLSIMWKSRFSYNGDVLPKESLYFYLTFPTQASASFSLSF